MCEALEQEITEIEHENEREEQPKVRARISREGHVFQKKGAPAEIVSDRASPKEV